MAIHWNPNDLFTAVKQNIDSTKQPHLFALLSQDAIKGNLIHLFKEAAQFGDPIMASRMIKDWVSSRRYDGLWELIEVQLKQPHTSPSRATPTPLQKARRAPKSHATPLPKRPAHFESRPSHSKKRPRRNQISTQNEVRHTGNHETIAKLKARSEQRKQTQQGSHPDTSSKVPQTQSSRSQEGKTRHTPLPSTQKRSSIRRAEEHTAQPKARKRPTTSNAISALQAPISKQDTQESLEQVRAKRPFHFDSRPPESTEVEKVPAAPSRSLTPPTPEVKTNPETVVLVQEAILSHQKNRRTQRIFRISALFICTILLGASGYGGLLLLK